MNILTSLRTLLLALILSIGVSYAYAAWSPPSTSPTGGNTDAPINVGGVTQVKAGALTVNGLLTAVSKLMVGGAGTPPGGLTLGVIGNVGADKYCDRNGNNCISAGIGAGGIQKRVTGTCSGGNFLVGVNPDGSVNCAAASGGTQFYQCPNIQRSINEGGTTSYCPTNCTGQLSTSNTCTYQEPDVQWPCVNGNNQWQSASCSAV
ncbi:MAG: hypothetical protein Q7S11_03935 [bacterium]|nr:hypothetical protein [bacterium]